MLQSSAATAVSVWWIESTSAEIPLVCWQHLKIKPSILDILAPSISMFCSQQQSIVKCRHPVFLWLVNDTCPQTIQEACHNNKVIELTLDLDRTSIICTLLTFSPQLWCDLRVQAKLMFFYYLNLKLISG